MKAALVDLTYQGLTVSFNEDGWFNATVAAANFGKRPVLYCLTFVHGLMKVGATMNMPRRLEELSSHGLLKPLLAEILIESCERHNLFAAERHALIEISKISENLGKEVFKTLPIQTVRDIFITAIYKSPDQDLDTHSEPDYDEISKKSGLYKTLLYLAKEKFKEESEKQAIDFVLKNTPENGLIDEQKWNNSLDDVHPFSLELIPCLGIKNATLIGRNVSYADRKKILESTALEARVIPFPAPDAPDNRAA